MFRRVRVGLINLMFFIVAMPVLASVNGSFRVTGASGGSTGQITVSFSDSTGRSYSEAISYGPFSTTQSVAAGFGAMFTKDDYRYGLAAKAFGDSVQFTILGASSVSSITASGTAAFNVDVTNWPTSGAVTPSIGIECDPDPIVSGEATPTCTASVAGGATGTVTFSLDGAAPWTTATLSSGSATVSAALLGAASVGSHQVTVQYSGDSNYKPTSDDTDVVVQSTSGGLSSTTIYSFNVGYDGAGNVSNYTHNLNGSNSTFGFSYDALNRLAGGSQTPASGSAQYFCWNYDSFGNRTAQVIAAQAFSNSVGNTCTNSGTLISNNVSSYGTSSYAGANSNRISSTNASGTSITPTYDSAGNMTNDGVNSFLYDAEGRVCAVQSGISILGGQAITGYLYDSEGRRIAKGALSVFSCDISSNGFTATNTYALDPNGAQVTETGWTGEWIHTNINDGGMLLATYDSAGPHYHTTDWLGSRRVQTDSHGIVEATYQNLPFGEFAPSNNVQVLGATEHHFTGKERDQESGLDYFGARYYSSSMGRFSRPDPSGLAYADPMNPQSFNLYGYVMNNPLINIDPDGLDCIHINNDTGAYEGFERGDCDNSTEDKANTGRYIDGHVDTIYTSTGDDKGIVGGYSGHSDDDPNALITGRFDTGVSQPVDMFSMNQDDRIQQLSQGVTADTQHSVGCIRSAYGLVTKGTAMYASGQPLGGSKRFVTEGTSLGTSNMSLTMRSILPFKGVGSFRAPVGGPGTGRAFQMAKTASPGAAIARYVPFIGLAMDAYSVVQLSNCLGK